MRLPLTLFWQKRPVWLLLMCLAPDPFAKAQPGPPNIIFIMTDDMGYGDLGCYGQKKWATPHIDRLAAQGMKFTQAYAAAPLCTPTRTGLMTGRYPARTPVGLKEPLIPTRQDSSYGLTADHPSLASLVKERGFATALIGKWHLGFLPQHNPTRNGFDYFFGIISGAADYVSHKGVSRQPDLYENDAPVDAAGYLTDLLTEKAVAYLKSPPKQPFLLVITYNAPHWPWQGPGDSAYADTADFRNGGTPAVYAAMIQRLDESIGTLLSTLDATGLSANTLVIFTNDNGGERYSEHGGLAKAKGSLWEGGTRVPAIVRWPGRIAPGSTTGQAIITMDWTATMLAAAGARAHPAYPLDGKNLLPLCEGRAQEEDRTFYWRTFQRQKQKAIRQGKWKYLLDEAQEYLFDLAADPGEQNNLKEQHPALLRKLKETYASWEKTVLTPIPL